MKTKIERPDIFMFHDYRVFLSEIIRLKKNQSKSFNNKLLAKSLEVTPAYISMLLKGKRELTNNLILPMGQVLGLDKNELVFFELLVNFNISKDDNSKNRFLDQMTKFKKYRDLNPEETRMHKYMSSWLNIAIREMSTLKDFNDDPKWIQAKLRYPANINEIKESLDFLVAEGFLQKSDDGEFEKPNYQIDCTQKVYTNSLIQFHRHFLKLASESTMYAASEERRLYGHIVSLEEDNINKAMEILNKAFEDIRSLQTKNKQGKDVYSIEMAFFPLTTGDERNEN